LKIIYALIIIQGVGQIASYLIIFSLPIAGEENGGGPVGVTLPMAKFKPQFTRLLLIDQCIREGNFPNCSTIAREHETSSKTIQRDIDYLRDFLHAPIEYESSKRGYYYSEPNYKLPALSINESDLFAICIAQKLLKQYENTPIYGKLQSVFEKIEASLPDKVAVLPSILEKRVSFFQEPRTYINPEIWEKVFGALRESRVLKMQYQVPGHAAPSEREVDPYHVVSYQGEWYLIGYCHFRKKILTFAISRIKNSEVLNTHFEIPRDFDFEKFTGSHFGIYWGDKEYKVKIKFSPEIAPLIKERTWHPTQQIKENRDGSSILFLKTNYLLEVKRWVLSWGSGAVVIGPKNLRLELRQEIRNILKFYK